MAPSAARGSFAPDKDHIAGHIKCGTGSNGIFRNIPISNCVCERRQGLASETVDGGVIEDITISNIAMREGITWSSMRWLMR